MDYNNTLNFAQNMDTTDPLSTYRDRFCFPMRDDGTPYVYLCGNSLGLQPKSTKDALMVELEDWCKYGVEGHFNARNPWMPYHEFLTHKMARIVGGLPHEVVVMNTLTVNLHLMMVSFYRPHGRKNKVIIEYDAFPSDKYAVESQIRFHGHNPEQSLIRLKAREGETLLRDEDILEAIEKAGDELALVMLGNTNYYTGQYFDMKSISQAGHAVGAMVGFDCAHGAGNVVLDLHDTGADFAVWCTYKYLNSGPGSLGGCFVHERHAETVDMPRFAGWWGHRKDTRFKMRDHYEPIRGAEAWQLSNPPILSLAAIKSSLDIFDEVGMEKLRARSIRLTGYLEYLIDEIADPRISIITPRDPQKRGSQLSIQVRDADKGLYDEISRRGVIADWREPDVIRVAPAALYNSFEDIFRFSQILKSALS